MVESPEPVGVRVLRKISAEIGPNATMVAKDYVVAKRSLDELVWLQKIKPRAPSSDDCVVFLPTKY